MDKVNRFEHQYWRVNLPENWEADSEPDLVSFFHPDGFGELQISTTNYDEPVTEELLSDLASEHLEAGADPEEVELGEFGGFSFDYEIEGEYCREWYLMYDTLMLFVTYICNVGDDDKEEDLVEFILESLTVKKINCQS